MWRSFINMKGESVEGNALEDVRVLLHIPSSIFCWMIPRREYEKLYVPKYHLYGVWDGIR